MEVATPTAASAPAGAAGNSASGQVDVCDRDDLDVQQYVNKLFPTEASLVGLDPLINCLKARIARVDAEILSAVRHQSSSGARARQDLDKARGEVEELFGKITEIRRKAEASELMVQEICRDIKKLDHAKRHLTTTITALRRLSMLVNAVDQLQRSVERHEYGEAAQLLEAVQQLFSHFQSYAQIPKVAELGGRLSALQASLQTSAMREFELLGVGEDAAPNSLLLERLRSCCLVVDALGPKARDELIDYVCKKEMGVYSQIFHTEGETAHLERTERRYAWLRKRLRAREDVWAIFPEAWRVPQLLCFTFCSLTRTHLAEILDLRAAEVASQVEGLLMAVKATNDFEQEMAERFGAPAAGQDGDEDGGAGADSPSQLAQRSEQQQHMEEGGSGAAAAAAGGEPGGTAAAAVRASPSFLGSISGVFQKHLKFYVDAEERQLMQTLDQLLREETWRPVDESDVSRSCVLKSASDLFGVIKKSLVRCAKFVTRGQAMLDLSKAFRHVIAAYAGKLRARLPRPAGGMSLTSATPAVGTADWHVKLGEEELQVVCCIVATAQYCHDMAGQLGKSVTKQLAEESLREQVDMGPEEGQYQDVVTQCLAALVLGVETRADAALNTMMRTNWAAVESVGDQSDFVNSFGRVLAEVAPVVGQRLNEVQFEFFCEKLSASFSPRYYEALLRCRRVGEAASQQLLLDTQAIRALLLDLPAKGRPSDPIPSSYAGYVSRQMGRSEALLKVVGSRPEVMVDSFAALMPDAAPGDFARLLELKPLRKSDAQVLLDMYTKRQQGGRVAQSPSSSSSRSGGHLVHSSATAGGGGAGGMGGGAGDNASALAAANMGSSIANAAATSITAQELAARFRLGTAGATARATAAAGSTMSVMKQLGMRMREASTSFRQQQ